MRFLVVLGFLVLLTFAGDLINMHQGTTGHYEQTFSMSHCQNSTWYLIESDSDNVTVACDPREDPLPEGRN